VVAVGSHEVGFGRQMLAPHEPLLLELADLVVDVDQVLLHYNK